MRLNLDIFKHLLVSSHQPLLMRNPFSSGIAFDGWEPLNTFVIYN